MNKEKTIKYLENEIPQMIEKCKNTKIMFLKVYRIGKLYIYNETYRRFTGKEFDISKGYFLY